MSGFDLFLDFPSQFEFGSFRCYECDVSFTDNADALKHLMGHLPKDFDDENENDKSSEYDPGEFEVNLEHSGESLNESQTRQKYHEMMHQPCEIDCPKCTKKFNSMADWGIHFKITHEVNEHDDIPASTSGTNISDINSDPPSPVFKPRQLKRIRDSLADDEKEDHFLDKFCNEVYEEWIEDEAFEVWLDHAVIPAFLELARKRRKRRKA